MSGEGLATTSMEILKTFTLRFNISNIPQLPVSSFFYSRFIQIEKQNLRRFHSSQSTCCFLKFSKFRIRQS